MPKLLMSPNTIDSIRRSVNEKLNPNNKSKFGQFMTPSVIAEFMASLFDDSTQSDVKLMDCGAGIGSLSISAINKLKNVSQVDLWEIDPIMYETLEVNMRNMDTPF